MKKVFLAAAIALVLALSAAGPALSAQPGQKPAQTEQKHPGTPVESHIDVCVNASNVAAAKALFPTARFHVIPDDPNPELNGWVVIIGFGDKPPHTDAEEIALRRRANWRTGKE
jgi:hypothetical protein